MALIEIDGLPINSMVIFHGKLLNKQMVTEVTVKDGGFQTECGFSMILI